VLKNSSAQIKKPLRKLFSARPDDDRMQFHRVQNFALKQRQRDRIDLMPAPHDQDLRFAAQPLEMRRKILPVLTDQQSDQLARVREIGRAVRPSGFARCVTALCKIAREIEVYVLGRRLPCTPSIKAGHVVSAFADGLALHPLERKLRAGSNPAPGTNQINGFVRLAPSKRDLDDHHLTTTGPLAGPSTQALRPRAPGQPYAPASLPRGRVSSVFPSQISVSRRRCSALAEPR
jgi:hypothetical protein